MFEVIYNMYKFIFLDEVNEVKVEVNEEIDVVVVELKDDEEYKVKFIG